MDSQVRPQVRETYFSTVETFVRACEENEIVQGPFEQIKSESDIEIAKDKQTAELKYRKQIVRTGKKLTSPYFSC